MSDQTKTLIFIIVFLLCFTKCCDSFNQNEKMKHEYNLEELRLKYTL